MLLAYGGVVLITAWLPEYSFPHEAAISVSLPVLFVSAAIALLTGIIFGISPAWQLSRPDVSQLMVQAGTTRLFGSARGVTPITFSLVGKSRLRCFCWPVPEPRPVLFWLAITPHWVMTRSMF